MQSHHNQQRLAIGQAQSASYVSLYSFFCLLKFVVFLFISLSSHHLSLSQSSDFSAADISSEKSVDSMLSKLSAVKASLSSIIHGSFSTTVNSPRVHLKGPEASRASCIIQGSDHQSAHQLGINSDSINEFSQVINSLTETTYQPENPKLTMLLKRSFTKVGQMNFKSHGHDAAHFIKKFYPSTVSTSKCESEVFSLADWQFICDPRANSD